MHLSGSLACPGPLLVGSSVQVRLSAQVLCPAGDRLLPRGQSSGAPLAPAVKCAHLKDLRTPVHGWSAPAASLRARLSLALSPSSFPFLEPELGLHCAPRPSPTMLHRERGAPSLVVQSSGPPKPSPTGQFPWNEIFALSTPVCLQCDSLGGESVTLPGL